MTTVLFDGLPIWVSLIPLLLSWSVLINDLIKTRKFLATMKKDFSFLTWGIKMTWLLLVGSVYPIPDNPWIMLLLIWVVLDMRIDFFSKVTESIKEGEEA